MSHLHAHGSTHTSGAVDAIKLDDLAAPDDNTDLNATVSAHGLLPKLGGGTTNFLRADGTWAAPSAAAGVYWAKITSGTDVAITSATSATLNRMHVVSGTSADYTITISGLSPTAGDVLGFYVKDYAAASKQFKLDAGGTVKVAGRTRYLVLTHANVVLLMWDGTDWQPLVLNLDSPWVNGGAIPLTAVTSNPTKGGGTTYDRIFWQRSGQSMVLRYEYRQTTAGTAGTGDYLFGLPLGTIDTALVTAETGASAVNTIATCGVGSGRLDTGGTLAFLYAGVYDGTRLRFVYEIGAGTSNFMASSTTSFANAATRFHVLADLPMTDW